MNLTRIPRERWLVIAAGTCLALLLADRVVLTPLLAAWRQRAQQIQTLEASIARGTALLDQESRWLRYRDEAAARLLPSPPAVAESVLLKQVDGWARSSGLRVTALRPRGKTAAAGESLVELQVTGSGSLDGMVRFLYSVETGSLAVATEALELTPGRQDGELELNLRVSGLCRPDDSLRSDKP